MYCRYICVCIYALCLCVCELHKASICICVLCILIYLTHTHTHTHNRHTHVCMYTCVVFMFTKKPQLARQCNGYIRIHTYICIYIYIYIYIYKCIPYMRIMYCKHASCILDICIKYCHIHPVYLKNASYTRA